MTASSLQQSHILFERKPCIPACWLYVGCSAFLIRIILHTGVAKFPVYVLSRVSKATHFIKYSVAIWSLHRPQWYWPRKLHSLKLPPWASCQIRKIAVCACAGNAGNVFPHRRFRRKPLVSDPGMHHGTCVTHVPWCMSGSLTCGGGENVPGIPGACAPAILCIWQEAHRKSLPVNWLCQPQGKCKLNRNYDDLVMQQPMTA